MILVPFIKKKVKIKNVTCTKDKVRIRRDKEGEEGPGHSWESDDWYSSFTDSSCSTFLTAGHTTCMYMDGGNSFEFG